MAPPPSPLWEGYFPVMMESRPKRLWLCSDMKDTHPLHIEPVAALRADDAHEHVVTRRTAHDRPHGALVDGEFTNHPGAAAMRTGSFGERHFKGENFSQDTACGIPIKCRIVHLGPSCRTETLRFDARRLISQWQQRCCRCFDERCRATDVGEGMLLHRPGDLSQELSVNATAGARPSWRLAPGERVDHLHGHAGLGLALQFVPVDDILIGAKRGKQPCRDGTSHSPAVPDHRHEGHDARSTCNQEQGSAQALLPDEVAAYGTT